MALGYENVSEYIQGLMGEGDQLLAWARKKSGEFTGHGVYAIDPTSGRMLELIARVQHSERVLEIGSGVGYSALWLMKGMDADGTLDAIEYNADVAKALKATVKKAHLEGRVKVHNGPALKLLRNMTGPYDLVFIDADKHEYPNYLEEALRLTKLGSVILADNMFWGGTAIRGGIRGEDTGGIIEYTKRIFRDRRLSSLILPLGDGLAISYRVK